MMKRFSVLLFIIQIYCISGSAQVEPSYLYNTSTPYGTLDIRTNISATSYYYLDEGKTFSYRESAPGVRTNTYHDMTSWESSDYLQGNLRLKDGADDKFVMNYRMLMPLNYQPTYAEGYPLVVMLHGGTERGNCAYSNCFHATPAYDPNVNSPPAPTSPTNPLLNNDYNLTLGGKEHLDARNLAGGKLPNDPTLPAKAFPGFAIFPQMLNAWDSLNVEDVIRIIRLHCEKYNIDQNRIYIHGVSIGGYGVYETVQHAPWLFAAALPISGVKDANIFKHNLQDKVAQVQWRIFQGDVDANPLRAYTEQVVNGLRSAGASVRYTVYPKIGHAIWGMAYGEQDFFSWILSKNKANIQPHSGNTVIDKSKNQYPKLMLSEGFLAYQWQLNGQIIPAATSASYVPTVAGTYRARFSRVENPTEAQWNKWSAPVEIKEEGAVIELPKPQIRQDGTVILNDLNNFTDAKLHAVGDFAHYYWYKDGTRIDFLGDKDDTVKNPIIKPAMGKGVYTLIIGNADNYLSPPSDGKYIFFNNEAPLNITAPANFTGVVNASAGIDLLWSDVSNNENGFEIWRRRKVDAASFSPWQMVVLTNANVVSFTDKHLLPQATYQYKIRAVSNTGRSDYAPAMNALELTVGKDTQSPSAPKNLAVAAAGVQKIKLTWNKSTDNTEIRQYYIYNGSDSLATNSTDTTYTFTNLAVNNVFNFKVRAIDLAGNLSLPSNVKQGSTYMSGLYYEYTTGVFTDLNSVNWNSPKLTGMVQTFTLSPKTQNDFFSFRFDGFIFITRPGAYQFRTSSDDGSRLKLDNVLLVDNDGVHNLKTVTSSSQTLTKGPHRITVDFFDYIETDSLAVEYKGADTNDQWNKVSVSVLKSTETVVTGLTPAYTPEDNFIVNVYPNPSTADHIYVQLQSISTSPVRIQLVDPIGKILFDAGVSTDTMNAGFKLSTSALSHGLYFVIVQQGGTTVRQRVIVHN